MMLLFFSALAVFLMIMLPLGLAILLRRQRFVPWWLFCLGMVTFVGSQVYHIPLNNWLTDIGILGEVRADAPRFWQTAVILGLSAGLSESIARAIGYGLLHRWQKAQDWHASLMIGLGHGGIEAMLVGAVLLGASMTSLFALQSADASALDMSTEQFALLETQWQLLNGSPWLVLASVLERMIAITLHITLSVLVWCAVQQRAPLYFVVAVLYHALFDSVAVYAGQMIESIWVLEGIFILLALPSVVWLVSGWQKQERPFQPQRAILTDLILLKTATAHELFYQWRTRRILIICVVFLLFGLGSPLLAKFTPEIIRNLDGVEQFADLIADPSIDDAMAQYIKNITQFGFLLAIVLGMGMVAREKERGTVAMILSKPLPRWVFIMSKFFAQMLVYLLGFTIATLGAYYYTTILFEPFVLGAFLLGNLLLWLWLLTYSAVTILASTLAKSTGSSAGIALAGAIFLLIFGGLPVVGAVSPSGLVAWASQLGLPTIASTQANGGALVMSVVLIVVCLLTAVATFEVQEL